ncbi:MAG: hypothetical protein IPJ65_31970 [Archangiaceae bacterium]|nr:hypothetical protein [Archangiaceae bacterium]
MRPHPRTPDAWRPIASVSAVVVVGAVLFFFIFPTVIAPRFALLFRDFGGALPFFTELALDPKTSLVALLFLAGGVAFAAFRPRERVIILSLTAGGGVCGVLAFMGALYLPIVLLAGQIK